jgi:predicted RNA-binding protein with PIN domain
VQSHTETIWKCLEHYNVPALIFVNKMDISHHTKEELLADLQKKCSPECFVWNDESSYEQLATIDEEMLERYLENGTIPMDMIRHAVSCRKCFPVLFGSALKVDGIKELLDAIDAYAVERTWPEEFGARVYKISADENNARLTHMRITGGTLKAKQNVSEEEKADQIRIYSGQGYRMIDTAEAGMIVTVKGFEHIEAGQGLGFEEDSEKPLLDPFMEYELLLPEGADALMMAETVRRLADEDPQLHITSETQSGKIRLSIMGEMQMEVLEKRIFELSGLHVGFSAGGIIFKETILEETEGAGHFEPLRHYAEVHVRLEPLERGSGIEVVSECSTDVLSASWQRNILSILERSRHRGVLTGSLLDDVRIVLTAGKGHIKHTEGGDFRQAARRAVRQALMKTECVLLEPYCSFTLTLPSSVLSRALYDLDQRKASVEISDQNDETMVISGRGPLRTLNNYQMEVNAYTRGKGKWSAVSDGYDVCLSQDEIVAESGYDPEADLRNPCGSVFCAHGSGYYVPWDKADELMHVQPVRERVSTYRRVSAYKVQEDDLMDVLKRASGNNRNDSKRDMRKPVKKTDEETKPKKPVMKKKLPPCLIVDGYNMIYSWEEYHELADQDITTAREMLIDELMAYQAYLKWHMIIVFDGYRVQDNYGTRQKMHDVEIVYTRTNETADEYIERITRELRDTYEMTVASSDGLIQNAIFAHGALRMSARELQSRMELLKKQFV